MSTTTRVQRIGPVLRYADADKAIAFLVDAFGFREHAVHRMEDGSVAHAELEYLGEYIGLSSTRPDDVDDIFDLGPCVVYVVVDDVDAHHAKAVAAGADVVYPLTDQDYGSRDYAVRDAEGFVWSFGTYRMGSEPETAQ
ncbi:MAG: VOC family protein [Acidimicrobiia bacterium]